VLNLLPLFIVGKPGTSKTLTMQVLSNNLQGNRSPNAFFRDFPAIHIFPYQCSPMSHGGAIQHQFDIACRFQQHATSIVSVLLLDEVGLAEHSPDMPLKVLHTMLVKPPIAIVGLSNWTLDSAKMNRAICIQRTEPSPLDIELTATSIVGSETSGRSEIGSLWRPQNPAIVSSTNASTEGSGCWMPQRERVMARRPGSGSGAVDDLHQVAVT
jgi:hypothetical protein